MDELIYEEVMDWYNNNKKEFDTWELNRVLDYYNHLVQEEHINYCESLIIKWAENILF